MKSTDLDQMCGHSTIHPNVLFKQHLKNLFMQDWSKQLQLTTGKLIKHEFIYEPYLELS